MGDKLSQEEALKESLLEVATLAKVLSPYCQSVQELIDMVEFAATSDAQFRLLLKVMKDSNKPERR